MENGIEGSKRGSGETNVIVEIRSERTGQSAGQTVEGQRQRQQVALVGRVAGK